MNPEVFVTAGGIISVIAALGHTFFPMLFHWGPDLRKISVLNAKIFMTVHLFLIPLFLLFALLSFLFLKELASGSGIGRFLTGFYAAFWFARLIWQLSYFRPDRSHESQKLIQLHYALVGIFFIATVCYLAPFLLASHVIPRG